MKKFYCILLVVCLCVGFTGCGKAESTQKETRATDSVVNQGTHMSEVNNQISNQDTQVSEAYNQNSNQDTYAETQNATTNAGLENKSSILIAYFTRADNIKIDPDIDATASASININGSSYKGNVAIIADYIKEVTGGDTFSILTKEYYPVKYSDTTAIAKKEQSNNARPELSNHVTNMADYDVVFLIYPNWWGGLPMPVYTFLEEYDFSGKTIIPVASHEGSGLGKSPSEIAKICPNSQIMDGMAVRGTEVSSSKDDIKSWIDGLNLN